MLRDYLSQVGLNISQKKEQDLKLVIDEHLKWNRKINLSAFHDELSVIRYQIIDSLTLLQTPLRLDADLLDIGSGPGFPGLPVAIVCPQLSVILVDSNAKKLAFATHIIGCLGLKNVRVLPKRISMLRGQQFSQITARAFASLSDIMSATEQLLDPSGTLYAMKSQQVDQEIADSLTRFPTSQVRVIEVEHVVPEKRVIATVTGYSQ